MLSVCYLCKAPSWHSIASQEACPLHCPLQADDILRRVLAFLLRLWLWAYKGFGQHMTFPPFCKVPQDLQGAIIKKFVNVEPRKIPGSLDFKFVADKPDGRWSGLTRLWSTATAAAALTTTISMRSNPGALETFPSRYYDGLALRDSIPKLKKNIICEATSLLRDLKCI